MKILFYDAATYDVESFEKELTHFPDIEIIYHEVDISPKTVSLAQGCDAICAFVLIAGPSVKEHFNKN